MSGHDSAGVAPRAAGYRKVLRHLAFNAPFAIAASSLQGAVNYFIVVYLAYGHSLADTGTYRALFSYYSLLGLASMVETNKIFIRSIVANDHEATTALFANRIMFSVAAFCVILIIWIAGFLAGAHWLPDELAPIAALAIVLYPMDSYQSLLQARGRFNLLFVTEVVKYGAALAVFLIALRLGSSVATAVLVQLATMALCHAIYFAFAVRTFVDFALVRHRFGRMIRLSAARQARTYSFSSLFPASLEHVDKILVGLVFGLEFLGVYTLAYSTGRFVYNTLKPAMYIYYRRFVDRMPPWRLLKLVSLFFTLVGAGMAAAFLVALARVPEMERFRSGAAATVILFLSYGIGILHAVYGQAFALNKNSVAGHALRASVLATAASLVLLGTALVSPPPIALVLLALQYPLRDGLSVWLMARYRRRHTAPHQGTAKSG